jgi:ankyrin repeat protein
VAVIIIAKKRKHVVVANAKVNSATSSKSKSKVQRPATGAEVNWELIWNVQNGDEEAKPLLLANGAKVDVTDESGSALLIIAASYGQEGVVRMLLEKGATVDAANN